MKSLCPCIILIVLFVQNRCVDSVDPATVVTALETGKTIVENLDKINEFISAITNLAEKAGDLLKGVASVINMIIGRSQSSPDVECLRDLSKQIFMKFDEISATLRYIQKLSHQTANLSPYLHIVLNIRAVSEGYEGLYTVPANGVTSQKEYFIKSYESTYQESGRKLYYGLVDDHGPFGANLLNSALLFYDNDRPKVRSFMAAMAKLLFAASQVELGYLVAIGRNESSTTIKKKEWEDRFKQLVKIMSTVDAKVESKWETQYKLDIDESMRQYSNYETSHISELLYEYISEKYYWRDWMVIVADHVYDQYDRNHLCGGYTKTIYGKDVTVASVPTGNSTIDEYAVVGMAASLKKTLSVKDGNADAVYSWINPSVRESCTNYNAVGVIYGNRNVAFKARSGICPERHCKNNYDCSPKGFERLFIYHLAENGNYFAYFFG